MLVAGVARGETWADEPTPPPPLELRAPPLFGLTAGMHLMLGTGSNVGPSPGARLGLRVRLGQHVALSIMGMYELESFLTWNWNSSGFTGSFTEVALHAHVVHGVLRLELFSQSAFEHLLVPELTVGLFAGAGGAFESNRGLFAGAGGAFESDRASASFLGGVHLGLTRLRPSGWWFPLFVEVGVQVFSFGGSGTPQVTAPLWRVAVGVGL